MRKSSRAGDALAILAVLACLLGFACFLATFAPTGDQRLDYWLAVISGNWFARSFQPGASFGESWEYWLGVVLAVSLNLGAISLLVSLVASLSFIKRSSAMNIMQAFDVLKADIQHEILKNLSDRDFEALEPVIKRAVEMGAKTWRDRSLVTLLGPRGAQQLLQEFETTKLEEAD